ncbi:1,2-epoxyphenylacetyl-CoA isomerase [compost metagenome]
MVDALHPETELEEAAEHLVQQLARAASGSLACIKTLCSGLPGRDLAAHLDLEHQFVLAQTRTSDAREGIRAFLARQSPHFN